MLIRDGKTVYTDAEYQIVERIRDAPEGVPIVEGYRLLGPRAEPAWTFGSVEQARGAIEVLRSLAAQKK